MRKESALPARSEGRVAEPAMMAMPKSAPRLAIKVRRSIFSRTHK